MVHHAVVPIVVRTAGRAGLGAHAALSRTTRCRTVLIKEESCTLKRRAERVAAVGREVLIANVTIGNPIAAIAVEQVRGVPRHISWWQKSVHIDDRISFEVGGAEAVNVGRSAATVVVIARRMKIIAACTLRVAPHECDAVERVGHVLVEPLVGSAPVARPDEIAGDPWR